MTLPAPASFTWPAEMPRDAIPILITVLYERAGMRLDKFLTLEMPRLSRTRAARIAAEFAFSAAGARLGPARIVKLGEVIVLFRPSWDEPEVPREIGIVHEDAVIIGIDKPAGLPVHPTAKFHKNTLTSILALRYPNERVALCHRLDKETSGVLLATRTLEAEQRLKRAFAERTVHKVYRAIVHGEVREDAFDVEAALALAGDDVAVLMAVRPLSEGGMPSRTRVRVITRLRGFTVVEAEPETGRQHQIRVHLAHAGHAIVGDKLYAHGSAAFVEHQKSGMTPELRALLLLERHALHAQRITFVHPALHAEITVHAPFPSDLVDFVERHAS